MPKLIQSWPLRDKPRMATERERLEADHARLDAEFDSIIADICPELRPHLNVHRDTQQAHARWQYAMGYVDAWRHLLTGIGFGLVIIAAVYGFGLLAALQ